MKQILDIALEITTPLSLAGFFAGAFFLISRLIISSLKKRGHAPQAIVIRIINYFFILSLLAMVLGFVAYLLTNGAPPVMTNPDPTFV